MASGHEMKAHEESYGGFLTMLKWGIALTIVVTVFVMAMIV